MVEPSCETSRVELTMNFGWAEANPMLFVARVKRFKEEHPVEAWRHHIDFTGTYSVKLIARRREEPFASVADYIMHDDSKTLLREIGMEP